MKCTHCETEKDDSKFKKTMRDGIGTPVCNYCRYDKGKRPYKDKMEVINDNPDELWKECLCGCGKFFETIPSIRFLPGHRLNVDVLEYSSPSFGEEE